MCMNMVCTWVSVHHRASSCRWTDKSFANFSEIVLPHKNPKPQLPAHMAKLGDFFRFWLLAVLKDGTYGLSLDDIFRGQ